MSVALPTRSLTLPADPFGGGIAGSIALHAALAALLLASGLLFHHGDNWGSGNSSGAIQASLVSTLPLPPKQFTDPSSVLATETPSPAPTPPAPKTIETPAPDAIPIPVKPAKPPKLADRTNPPPPLHPQPTTPQPNKATTGTAAAPQIAMTTTQTRVGTVSVGTPDSGFGSRFAYYVQQITQKVAQQWYTGMLDTQAPGHRVCITFQVARDGTPSEIRVAQPSGDATLDQTAMSAVRRIDTFGPLPDAYTGNHIDVTYYFDPPPHP